MTATTAFLFGWFLLAPVLVWPVFLLGWLLSPSGAVLLAWASVGILIALLIWALDAIAEHTP